jgi:hypothetical protein
MNPADSNPDARFAVAPCHPEAHFTSQTMTDLSTGTESNATPPRKKRYLVLFIVGIFCLLVGSPIALLALIQMPGIYYSEFNSIKARLEALPNTRIVDSWRHEDITLEDCGFDLQVRECEPIRIDFYEGGNWDRDFGTLDGIIFSKPYNPATNGYETTPISSEELARAGIHVRSLTDLVAQLEALQAYLKTRPQQPHEAPHAGSYYIRIYYDLDAYKQARHSP